MSATNPTETRFRPAVAADVDQLAGLLVQLYEHELPGMLRGSYRARSALTRRLLTSAPLGLRYVLEDGDDVVATGGIATSDEPRPDTTPSAILSVLWHTDPVRAVMTIAGAVRGVATIAAPPAAHEVLIHSVVVARDARGRGLGRRLAGLLEEEGRARGRTDAILQVVSANAAAQAFYRSLGYVEYPNPSRWPARWVGYPSVMMRRTLPSGP